jgi:hypothetical protein
VRSAPVGLQRDADVDVRHAVGVDDHPVGAAGEYRPLQSGTVEFAAVDWDDAPVSGRGDAYIHGRRYATGQGE